MRPLAGAWMLAASLGAASVGTACEPVPDLHFVADADVDVDVEPLDAGDASLPVLDAASDAASSDAIAEGGCVGPAPEGGLCCGTKWCGGGCTQQNCPACESKGCAPSELCCHKGAAAVTCKTQCN